jgi:hypothetical protein
VYSAPSYEALGNTEPVGARSHLMGRHHIIMTEWFPWDHEEPLARRVNDDTTGQREHRWEIHKAPLITGFTPIEPGAETLEREWGMEWRNHQDDEEMTPITITGPDRPGVHSYRIQFHADEYEPILEGTFINAEWNLRVFPWTIDPRDDLKGWLRESESEKAMSATTNALNFKFAGAGPSQMGIAAPITDAAFAPDHFGTIATTTIPLDAGTWRITTTSDDGIRVHANDDLVIDNWTWHGPTKDAAEFALEKPTDVTFLIEHFEIDGYAWLEFNIEKADEEP